MALFDTKPASSSVTIWGAGAALVSQLLMLAKIDIAPEMVMQVVGGVGAVVAIFGRLRATKRVGNPDPTAT